MSSRFEILQELNEVGEKIDKYTASYPKRRKNAPLNDIETRMNNLRKEIILQEDRDTFNRLLDKLTDWYVNPEFMRVYTKRKPRVPKIEPLEELAKLEKQEEEKQEEEDLEGLEEKAKQVEEDLEMLEGPVKYEDLEKYDEELRIRMMKEYFPEIFRNVEKSKEESKKEDETRMGSKPASAKQDETRMGSKPASAKQDETRMGSKPASAKQDEIRMGSKPASAKQDETRMGSKPKPPRDVIEMDLEDIEDVDVEEMDLEDIEDVDVEEMDLADIEDVDVEEMDLADIEDVTEEEEMKEDKREEEKIEEKISPEMEEIHNNIRKEEREKVMREFNLVDPTIGTIDIPKERLGIEGKTLKILNDDIKYFINRFPDMLMMEADVYKKTNKKNKKALQEIHRRIQAKLSPDPKKEEEGKKVGIILDADKFIDMKISELLATKTLEGLTPANLVDITEQPKSQGRDVGSYTITRKGGRDIINNAPVYRSIPTTQPEKPKRKGEINQDTIYKNTAMDKVDIARMEMRDNPFIRKQKSRPLNIIL